MGKYLVFPTKGQVTVCGYRVSELRLANYKWTEGQAVPPSDTLTCKVARSVTTALWLYFPQSVRTGPQSESVDAVEVTFEGVNPFLIVGVLVHTLVLNWPERSPTLPEILVIGEERCTGDVFKRLAEDGPWPDEWQRRSLWPQ